MSRRNPTTLWSNGGHLNQEAAMSPESIRSFPHDDYHPHYPTAGSVSSGADNRPMQSSPTKDSTMTPAQPTPPRKTDWLTRGSQVANIINALFKLVGMFFP
ncbi:MAG TPA: hypothetical protein VHR66_24285 [Gemmataceae bacterium]|jgi:hypothetical protein|nr:hypothetical protein [Gemmataceae bacterium]